MKRTLDEARMPSLRDKLYNGKPHKVNKAEKTKKTTKKTTKKKSK